jgi:hypothetical protein
MRKQKHLVIIALMLFVLPQCKKYPQDEEFIHLRSAKDRLCKHGWCTGGPDCNNGFHFYKDGTMDGIPFLPSFIANNVSNWELIDHYKALRFYNPNNNFIYDFQIKRLEEFGGEFYLTLANDTLSFDLEGPSIE